MVPCLLFTNCKGAVFAKNVGQMDFQVFSYKKWTLEKKIKFTILFLMVDLLCYNPTNFDGYSCTLQKWNPNCSPAIAESQMCECDWNRPIQ